MRSRLLTRFEPHPARAAGGAAFLALHLTLVVPSAGQATIEFDTDRTDITGRQNLTLGSGARAYGMGGAFLARADDATAASWNPAGLSYLRVPEVSFTEEASSDGGFDVVAFGTGLQLSRLVRAGFTVNRWLGGYGQTLALSPPTSDSTGRGGTTGSRKGPSKR